MRIEPLEKVFLHLESVHKRYLTIRQRFLLTYKRDHFVNRLTRAEKRGDERGE
jgi:hypothetical protein